MKAAQTDKTYALFSTAANKKLIGSLREKGAKVFLFPPLDTEKSALNSAETMRLLEITAFDWIIFTDIFAIEYFLQTLAENNIDAFALDAVKVCAFGEAVSDRLRFAQLHADLVPVLIETENIISDLSAYLDNKEIKKLKFLVVKENADRPAIIEQLWEKGAEVFELPIYKAKIADKTELTKLKILLTGGAIDEFVFSEASDFFGLKFYFPGERLNNVLSGIEISATGENALQTAAEFGLAVV
jgi:uroporphyrinogen-III synthase